MWKHKTFSISSMHHVLTAFLCGLFFWYVLILPNMSPFCMQEIGHFLAAFPKNVKLGIPFFIPNFTLGTFGAITQVSIFLKEVKSMGLWEFLGQLNLNVFLFLDWYWSVACCECILIRPCTLMFSSILADLKATNVQPTT